jgi:hypothetical protein
LVRSPAAPKMTRMQGSPGRGLDINANKFGVSIQPGGHRRRRAAELEETVRARELSCQAEHRDTPPRSQTTGAAKTIPCRSLKSLRSRKRSRTWVGPMAATCGWTFVGPSGPEETE